MTAITASPTAGAFPAPPVWPPACRLLSWTARTIPELGTNPNGVNNNFIDRPNCAAGSLNINTKNPNLAVFNTSLFSQENLGQLGNCPLADFSGPGLVNFDMTIAKNVRLTESKSLEFRAEAFNVFNTPQFFIFKRMAFRRSRAISPLLNFRQNRRLHERPHPAARRQVHLLILHAEIAEPSPQLLGFGSATPSRSRLTGALAVCAPRGP